MPVKLDEEKFLEDKKRKEEKAQKSHRKRALAKYLASQLNRYPAYERARVEEYYGTRVYSNCKTSMLPYVGLILIFAAIAYTLLRLGGIISPIHATMEVYAVMFAAAIGISMIIHSENSQRLAATISYRGDKLIVEARDEKTARRIHNILKGSKWEKYDIRIWA